jgi:hypothetical protein
MIPADAWREVACPICHRENCDDHFPPTTDAPSWTLSRVEKVCQQWFQHLDVIPLRAALATYLANRCFEGDPVWLMLVGGSGRGKTELLTPFGGRPDVVLASSISSPGALLSGTSQKEIAKGATGGLLRLVPHGGGVLILKDFTSILSMHRESRAEVLAGLREIYDGRWDRAIGADGGRMLTWIGHLGLIAGCTTAIDSAHAVIGQMGTRFVFVRLPFDDALGHTVLKHVGREEEMRDELRTAIHGLLACPPHLPRNLTTHRNALASLGSFIALARSPVERDHRGEIVLVLDPEAPTRIVKMLAQLWRASGFLGLPEEEAWSLVQRIGLDSIPKLRLLVLEALRQASGYQTTTQIAEAVEHPTMTTRRALEDLTAHRMVTRRAGGEGRPDHWTMSELAQQWLAAFAKPDIPLWRVGQIPHEA